MAKLSLDQVAKIAEISASVCVIASLIWVAIELDLNTKEISDSNAQSITAMAVDNRIRMFESGISGVVIKAARGDELTDEESLDLRFYYQYLFQEIELVHYQFVNGRLDTQLMDAWTQRFKFCFENDVCERMWELNKPILSKRFVEFGEGLRQ